MDIRKLLKLDFLRYVKNKRMIISITIMPILASIITLFTVYFLFNGNYDKLKIGMMNEDKNDDMTLIMSVVNQTPAVKENVDFVEYKDLKTMKNHIASEELDCAVKIPKGFINNIYDYNEGEVEFYKGENPSLKVMIFHNMVTEVVKLADHMRNSLDVLWDSMGEANLTNKEKVKIYNKEAETLIFNMFSRDSMFQYKSVITMITYYLVYFVIIFMYVNFIATYRNITCEDEKNMIQRLKLYNCSKDNYILSKCVICFVLQLLVNMFILGIPLYILNIGIIYIIINIILITMFNGIVVFTFLNMFSRDKKSSMIITTVLVLSLFFSRGSVNINPLKISAYTVFNCVEGNKLLHYRSILISLSAMILINILFAIIKKFFSEFKEGVINEKMS